MNMRNEEFLYTHPLTSGKLSEKHFNLNNFNSIAYMNTILSVKLLHYLSSINFLKKKIKKTINISLAKIFS